MKHTPGPWEVGTEGSEIGAVYCDNSLGSRVAIVFGKGQEYTAFSRTEEEANASLIAAAPDLLEALVQAERLYTTYGLVACDSECGAWINKVRTAIAKATSSS